MVCSVFFADQNHQAVLASTDLIKRSFLWLNCGSEMFWTIRGGSSIYDQKALVNFWPFLIYLFGQLLDYHQKVFLIRQGSLICFVYQNVTVIDDCGLHVAIQRKRLCWHFRFPFIQRTIAEATKKWRECKSPTPTRIYQQ